MQSNTAPRGESVDEWLTPSEYAKQYGVEYSAVRERMRKKKYKPFIRRKSDGRYEVNAPAFEKLVDKRLSAAQYLRREKAGIPVPEEKKKIYRLSNTGPLGEGGRSAAEAMDYLEEKRKWSARAEELKYKRQLKELVSASAVATEAAAVARLARDQLLQLPDRLAGQLVEAKDYDDIFFTINTEINRVLQELTKSIEKINIDDSPRLETHAKDDKGNTQPEPLERPEVTDDDDDEDAEDDPFPDEGEEDFSVLEADPVEDF